MTPLAREKKEEEDWAHSLSEWIAGCTLLKQETFLQGAGAAKL